MIFGYFLFMNESSQPPYHIILKNKAHLTVNFLIMSVGKKMQDTTSAP